MDKQLQTFYILASLTGFNRQVNHMKIIYTLGLWLLITSLTQAQTLPVNKAMWGKDPEMVGYAVQSAPGWELTESKKTEDGAYWLFYASTTGGAELLAYLFRGNKLIKVVRSVELVNKDAIAPENDWVKVGQNEWLVMSSNAWIKRLYNGARIEDTIRPIE